MSRQLRMLLKQNRVLEEKLFYQPRKTDWREQLITTQELSEALSYLSKKVIENRSAQLSVLKLLNEVDKIKGRPLAAFEKNALQVVEIIFNYLRTYSKFDTNYYHILNSLQLAFTRLSLNDLSYLDNEKHVAVRFLEQLIELGYHFDKKAGKLAQLFIHALELLTDRLANQEQVTNQTFTMADDKFTEYFTSFNEKVEANINQILSDIEKESRTAQADQYTDELIKSKIDGEENPIFLLDFFEKQITPLMYKVISQHGVQSEQCQQLLTDMDTLSWSITYPLSDEEYQQKYESDVTGTMKRLYQLFDSNDALNEYVKEFFFDTEELHRKKLDGQRVHYDVMICADIFADETYEDQYDDYQQPSWQQVEDNTPQFDIESLEEGAWYHLTHDGITTRSKLLHISHLTEQLIFINLSGELVLKISFSDSDYLTKNLKSTRVDEKIQYKHAIKALVKELASRLDILKTQFQHFVAKQAQDAKDQKIAEEKARKAIQIKIEEEKRQQILLRQKQEEEARIKEEQMAKQRFHIKGIYRKLLPGTVVAYENDAGKWTEATLSLISKTTQRHIFSDNRGNKLFEPTKDEVLELINEQRIKIVTTPPSSQTDPLQSLVKQRRQKLGKM